MSGDGGGNELGDEASSVPSPSLGGAETEDERGREESREGTASSVKLVLPLKEELRWRETLDDEPSWNSGGDVPKLESLKERPCKRGDWERDEVRDRLSDRAYSEKLSGKPERDDVQEGSAERAQGFHQELTITGCRRQWAQRRVKR